MVRFFVAPQDVSSNSIRLSAEDTEHIRSLRLRPDEQFIICDCKGVDYVCRFGKHDEGTVAEIISQRRSHGEPSIICKVFIAYSKGDKLDYAVQKSVELGASEIVLFESERCVAVPRDVPKKTARLQRIAFETAKQSDRGIIPKVTSVGKFGAAINDALNSTELSLLFYECEEDLHIKSVLDRCFSPIRKYDACDIKSVSIITGPEGGFETREIELAKSKGIYIVSLGPRILRSETAPVVALASIMLYTENMK